MPHALAEPLKQSAASPPPPVAPKAAASAATSIEPPSLPPVPLSHKQQSQVSPANKQRSALRGTPGSACPQPEPNATELPSCAPISARDAQIRRRRRCWCGDEGARRPGPEAQVLPHVLRHARRHALHVHVLHVPPKGRRLGGSRPGMLKGAPPPAPAPRVAVATRGTARRRIPFCPLKGRVRRFLYVPALHMSTATATGPAAPTVGFERSKSARR